MNSKSTSKVTSVTDKFRSKPLARLRVTLTSQMNHAPIRHGILSLIVADMLLELASSGPYGPLLARSGYPGQDASFYNNQMGMICSTENALTLL